MKILNRQHPLPIYYQLKEILREKIAQGGWLPGEQIPSERELSEQYRVSRATVRQALEVLIEEGCVERQQGLGTFVVEPKIVQHLTRLTGYTEDMQRRGLRPTSRIIQLEKIQASSTITTQLQITPDTAIVVLTRLRLAERIPMALESSYLHFPNVQELLGIEFGGTISLYKVLSEQFGIIPTRMEQRMEAALCTPLQQEQLEIEAGSPILKNARVTYDQNNRPFEYVQSAYRGDRYVFFAELMV